MTTIYHLITAVCWLALPLCLGILALWWAVIWIGKREYDDPNRRPD